jgi:ferredoxin
MARKGLIFSVAPDDGPALYQAVPWVVGIYEFQVNKLDPELLAAIEEYERTVKFRIRRPTIPQLRTIPVGESVTAEMAALPYERVGALLDAKTRYAVAHCLCRMRAKMTGAGCQAPKETCLMFDEWADYYVRNEMARYIDRAEVDAILARADDANLVLQPSNSQDAAALCCCCGCCCGLLQSLRGLRRPARIVGSAFLAALDAEACVGCGVCLDRCQMEALADDGDTVSLNAERCIGCGLCVSTCPSGALTLARKPESAFTQPPATLDDTWEVIVRTQGGRR